MSACMYSPQYVWSAIAYPAKMVYLYLLPSLCVNKHVCSKSQQSERSKLFSLVICLPPSYYICVCAHVHFNEDKWSMVLCLFI